jgi:hypothetical protein
VRQFHDIGLQVVDFGTPIFVLGALSAVSFFVQSMFFSRPVFTSSFVTYDVCVRRTRSTIYGEGPYPLPWAGSRAARGKLTITGIPYHLNFYSKYISTNVTAGRIIQPGGPRVEGIMV